MICIVFFANQDYPCRMKYIPRDIEPALRRLLSSFPSVAVTGPRQSGKSTLLKELLSDYRYITLDDPLLREQALSDPLLLLDSAGDRIILDEIQLAPGLLSYIKMRIDNDRGRKGRYVFTGSQQFTMIRDLGDSLAGRIGLLDLLPFSVAEKRRAIDLTDGLACFIDACLRGGWPELVVDPATHPADWYGSYLQTYIERDVRALYNIGNLRDFQRFMRLLATRCGQTLNYAELAGEVGVSVPTVKSWLSVLEASRLIYPLPPHYNNLGKRIVKAPKIYFTDCGLVCYLTGIKDADHVLQGPMAGALFENYCIQELLKLFFARGERPSLFYLRTNNDLEVDLLIETSFQMLVPVEFKLSKTPSRRMASGIQRFWNVFPSLKTARGMVVCLTDSSIPLAADINALSVQKFLEAVESL
jgi:predicted AAA+ superfamily ATPase